MNKFLNMNKHKTNMDKRGISPLIATVLIIGFTIVIAAIVITFGTNLVKEQIGGTKEEITFSELCNKVDLSTTAKTPALTGNIELTITNNNNGDIEGLIFTAIDTAGGRSGVISTHDIVKTGQYLGYTPVKDPTQPILPAFVTKKITLTNGWDPGFIDYDEIEVRPIVKDAVTQELRACSTPVAKTKKI